MSADNINDSPASPGTPSSPNSDSQSAAVRFVDLALPEPLLRALSDVGYESPSPIQAATIPPLLAGRDMIGQAQTGTGKTAAFALPILARIDPKQFKPQALVLAPTRELAIQVAEAFQKYARHLPRFQVLPIYGGQSYYPQLQALKRGVQVIVGTPGRVIDHLNRGSLDLSELRYLVLDEADEMLRMGFIDDVEAVLKKTPDNRQVALFSATMPAQIKRIAQTYLKDPVEVAIKSKTSTTTNTRQRYWMVSGVQKLDALTRILEAEPFEAMIVFVRTKLGTEELAGKLAARGISAAAINGDIAQAQREKTIQQLKDGRIDVLVATDVAARGLDVERVSHVLNYDIPYDTESYVHRIGRTGRAGREGQAILFVTPRERGMLRAIERATRQPIEAMGLPTIETVNEQRVSKFLGRIEETLQSDDLGVFRELVERYEREHNVPAVEIAAALAKLAQGGQPLLLDPPAKAQYERPVGRDEPRVQAHAQRAHPQRAHAPREHGPREHGPREHAPREHGPREHGPREHAPREHGPRDHAPREYSARERPQHQVSTPSGFPPMHSPGHKPMQSDANRAERTFDADSSARPPRAPAPATPGHPEIGMETFRIEVGHVHGVQPGNIVGAIANEAELESRYIGRIDIREDHSLVDLPEGMPRELMEFLKKVRVAGRPLQISRAGDAPSPAAPSGHRGQTVENRGPRPPGRGKPHPGGKSGRPSGPGGKKRSKPR